MPKTFFKIKKAMACTLLNIMPMSDMKKWLTLIFSPAIVATKVLKRPGEVFYTFSKIGTILS